MFENEAHCASAFELPQVRIGDVERTGDGEKTRIEMPRDWSQALTRTRLGGESTGARVRLSSEERLRECAGLSGRESCLSTKIVCREKECVCPERL